MSNTSRKKDDKHVSTLASNSPVDLYWLHRPVEKSQEIAVQTAASGTEICDKFWDDFLIVAKAVKRLNPEADLYDAFDFIRVHMLGGWTIIEDSQFIKDIDEEIEREYRREQSRSARH